MNDYTAGYTLTYEEWLEVLIADPQAYGYTKEQADAEYTRHYSGVDDEN